MTPRFGYSAWVETKMEQIQRSQGVIKLQDLSTARERDRAQCAKARSLKNSSPNRFLDFDFVNENFKRLFTLSDLQSKSPPDEVQNMEDFFGLH